MNFTIIWSEIRVARGRSGARARLGTAARCHRADRRFITEGGKDPYPNME
jgi:hypothetical protein